MSLACHNAELQRRAGAASGSSCAWWQRSAVARRWWLLASCPWPPLMRWAPFLRQPCGPTSTLALQAALSHIPFTQLPQQPRPCTSVLSKIGLPLTSISVDTMPPDVMFVWLLQLLPAPFPTTKPWRLYCSNMAVATAHRRQGLAMSLLHHCQRVGMIILPSLVAIFMQFSALSADECGTTCKSSLPSLWVHVSGRN